ncbi:DUF6286 domain-containing protein [Streptomyces sp. NPDC096080]|uniref:DUF6286 domain-containing Asp23/Gls24 family envelope stress response protein n=1 Tax=Streptomyces sp. NPDC096080 TaxID=3156693 RepID=UPI0033170DA4
MTTAARRGTTTVSDRAVRRIAERAATEVLPGTAGATRGSATVRGRRAEVAVEVPLPYPAPLADTARRVQDHVAHRTAHLTGLDLRAPRVGVTSLTPARAELPVEGAAVEAAGRTPLRWWSQRRLPIALLTLPAAVACGALAFDLVLVHTGHQPPAPWRTAALDWLSTHGPSATASTVGAAALGVLGVVLITLAVTPGRRGLLTVTSGAPRLVTAVDRSALSSLVGDAVRDTDGVGQVRVRVGRRRVTVRAGLAFGDRDRAREAVRDAARRVLEGCALRRTPRLRVTVRPQPIWDGAPAPAAPPAVDLTKRGAAPAPGDTGSGESTTGQVERGEGSTGSVETDIESGNRGIDPATARTATTGRPPTVPGHRPAPTERLPADRLPVPDRPATESDRPHPAGLSPTPPDRPHTAPDTEGPAQEGATR